MEVHHSDSNHTDSQLDFLSLVRSARTACHLQCHSAVVFNPLQPHISKRNQAGHINACYRRFLQLVYSKIMWSRLLYCLNLGSLLFLLELYQQRDSSMFLWHCLISLCPFAVLISISWRKCP